MNGIHPNPLSTEFGASQLTINLGGGLRFGVEPVALFFRLLALRDVSHHLGIAVQHVVPGEEDRDVGAGGARHRPPRGHNVGPMSLQDWTDAVCVELGIEPDYDLDAILETARDVAHGVERRAAPVTAFLVGYAAAKSGGTPEDLDRALDQVTALATRWEE